jgi:hypothetical protein
LKFLPLGRARHEWDNNIKAHLKEVVFKDNIKTNLEELVWKDNIITNLKK